MIVGTRLRAPARGTKLRISLVFAHSEDVAQFRPVVHIFKGELFDWCSGDDHAVIALVANVIQIHVERFHVLGGYVRCFMRDGLQKVDLNLQGRIRELAQNLGFCFDFQGHQIQDEHTAVDECPDGWRGARS